MAKQQALQRTDILARAYQLMTPKTNFLLSTVDGDAAPHTRWMGAAVLDKPRTVFMITGARTHKVVHIQVNPQVQLLFSSEGFKDVVAVNGRATVVEDAAVKRRIYGEIPAAKDYFDSPDSPDYAVIRVEIQTIELITADHPHVPFRVEL